MDCDHRSLTGPVLAAAVLGVTGILLACLVKVDVLSSLEFLVCPGIVLMVYHFISTGIVDDISWAGDIRYVGGGFDRVGVHYADDEECFLGWILFNSIGCALIHAAFMINPSIFAKLVLD